MKVRLNLATSPLENHRRFISSAALLGTVATLALVLLSWHAYTVWRADRDHRNKMARLGREMADFERRRRELEDYFNRPDTLKKRDRAAFLNGLIEQRSFPWTKIFVDLEEVLPEGVRVVSIAPKMDAGRVEVKLVIGAMTDEGKLKFLRALESSKEFSHVQVLAESRPTTHASETDRVRLDLVALYSTT